MPPSFLLFIHAGVTLCAECHARILFVTHPHLIGGAPHPQVCVLTRERRTLVPTQRHACRVLVTAHHGGCAAGLRQLVCMPDFVETSPTWAGRRVTAALYTVCDGVWVAPLCTCLCPQCLCVRPPCAFPCVTSLLLNTPLSPRGGRRAAFRLQLPPCSPCGGHGGAAAARRKMNAPAA